MRSVLVIGLVSLLLLAGCSKEDPIVDPDSSMELILKLEDGYGMFKGGTNCAFDVDYAMVIIGEYDNKNKRQKSISRFPTTYIDNGVLYTVPFTIPKPPKGRYYMVDECLLYADENTVESNPTGDRLVSAAPHAGSFFSTKFTSAQTVDFVLDAFNKTTVGLSVFCFDGTDPSNYGFRWFKPAELIVRQKWFYGSFFPDNYIDYLTSSYDLAGRLSINMPAIFKVQVYRDKNLDGVFATNELQIEFGNETDYLLGQVSPLSVMYAEGADDTGRFELRFLAYLKEGAAYTYKKVGSVYFEGNDPGVHLTPFIQRNLSTDPVINPGIDNIFEFTIGNSTEGGGDFRFGY
jgi:hypothetical protein